MYVNYFLSDNISDAITQQKGIVSDDVGWIRRMFCSLTYVNSPPIGLIICDEG